MHRDVHVDDIQAVTIEAQSGSWSNAVHLLVTDEQGVLQPWNFELAHAPAGAQILGSGNVADLAWRLAPEETAGVPAGLYRIVAYLDSMAVGAPFDDLNTISSGSVVLTLSAPTAPQSDQRRAERRLLFADYYILGDDDAAALAEVDALLAEQPMHVRGLAYRAQLLRLDGRLLESLDSYAEALNAFIEANPDAEEPPFTLMSEYYELLAEIESQTTFNVTVAPKSPLHPTFEQGFDQGFLIHGVEGGEIWLQQDTTYTFSLSNVPAESPFYVTTSSVGNGEAIYSDGVIGQPASGNDEVTFTPGADTPDILYYQSMNQPSMGWRIHIIRDAGATGIERPALQIPLEYHLSAAYPNPFNVETRVTLTIARSQHVVVKVYNLEGREVRHILDARLSAGTAHDIVLSGLGLGTGIYFIQILGDTFSISRGVMLVR
jgi:hypothetical protein